MTFVKRKPVVLHLLGNTGSGKTTLLDFLTSAWPDDITGISVGREFRKKYPPEFFEGQAAPAHTEQEAMSMYTDFVTERRDHGYGLIIVDGQPRKQSQVAACINNASGLQHDFLLVHADHGIRNDRLDSSRSGSSLELAIRRLDTDYRNQYEVMVELARLGLELNIVDSGKVDTPRIAMRIWDRYLKGACHEL